MVVVVINVVVVVAGAVAVVVVVVGLMAECAARVRDQTLHVTQAV